MTQNSQKKSDRFKQENREIGGTKYIHIIQLEEVDSEKLTPHTVISKVNLRRRKSEECQLRSYQIII